jgi:methyl-accepting chemotaxis protein
MFKKMSLRSRVLASGIALTLILMAVVSIVVWWQNDKMIDVARAESIELAQADLAHIAQSVYRMCVAQQHLLERKVRNDLNAAYDMLKSKGQVHLAGEMVSWDATSQCDHHTLKIRLPKMLAGDTWLGQDLDVQTAAPIVDHVKSMVGDTCTVFQRMNEAGDLLRVCTNVVGRNGHRAVGTYIPAVEPDGSTNPMISAILNGQVFVGRTYVVDAWYVAAYRPLVDVNQNVVGVLCVGLKLRDVPELYHGITDIVVGKTGYVFIIGGSGGQKGRYIVSCEGQRDGENVWKTTDETGRYVIQSIVAKALATRNGDCNFEHYPWRNKGESHAREKIAALTYFEPWDWVIGVSSYEDEFLEASNKIAAIGRQSQLVLGAALGICLVIGILLWLFTTRSITKPLRNIFKGLRSFSNDELAATGKNFHAIIGTLRQGVGEMSSAAAQVSSAAQLLANGSGEQTAAAEATAKRSTEMAAMIQQNANNAQKAKTLTDTARAGATKVIQTMTRKAKMLANVQKSQSDASKLLKVIDDFAVQTNLLALHAAMEAARAGEAGKSFALMAEEVRNLAQRSTEASKNAASLIEEAARISDSGMAVDKDVIVMLHGIAVNWRRMNELIDQIATAGIEQTRAMEQINGAFGQVRVVTEKNYASAEESAAAAEELSAQAEELSDVVRQLRMLIEGTDVEAQRGPDKELPGRTSTFPAVNVPVPCRQESAAGPRQPVESSPTTAAKDLPDASQRGPQDAGNEQPDQCKTCAPIIVASVCDNQPSNCAMTD